MDGGKEGRKVEKAKELQGAFYLHVYVQSSWQIPLLRPVSPEGKGGAHAAKPVNGKGLLGLPRFLASIL